MNRTIPRIIGSKDMAAGITAIKYMHRRICRNTMHKGICETARISATRHGYDSSVVEIHKPINKTAEKRMMICPRYL